MKIETEFTGLPLSKLESLLNNGWKVNGVHIQSVQMDGTLKHGAVTTGGMVLWWHPEQKRVIAPSVRSVAQQTLDALEKFGRGESSGISMTVLVHNLREALAAPNSVEFDGIETQPAHRAPVATFDEVFDAIDWDVWRMQPIRELVRMIHGKTAPQPATQQAPDALHLAAMDLARKQADRMAELEKVLVFVERWAVHHAAKPHMTAENALSFIQHHPSIRAITDGYADGVVPDTFDPFARIAELEAEVTRFRADAMNEKSARQSLGRQLAAREPLTDEQKRAKWIGATIEQCTHENCYFRGIADAEAYHGITKDPS